MTNPIPLKTFDVELELGQTVKIGKKKMRFRVVMTNTLDHKMEPIPGLKRIED